MPPSKTLYDHVVEKLNVTGTEIKDNDKYRFIVQLISMGNYKNVLIITINQLFRLRWASQLVSIFSDIFLFERAEGIDRIILNNGTTISFTEYGDLEKRHILCGDLIITEWLKTAKTAFIRDSIIPLLAQSSVSVYDLHTNWSPIVQRKSWSFCFSRSETPVV